MNTDEKRWVLIRDLFDRATELPTHERRAFIDQSSGDDLELRDEVLSLLVSDRLHRKRILTGAFGELVEDTADWQRRKLIGSTVGNYSILDLLGHGGTGTVYLATLADGDDLSRYAIKIVHAAAECGDAHLRFQAEKQILAKLNHPHIARLFDAGDTYDGYPYVVMDYVDGIPIDKYCDAHQLSVKDRLKLFLNVCSAVEFAHQHLVIHRDIKPSNILVTVDGVPKLLDFGIAKLLEATPDLPQLPLTRMNLQMLTPDYASPEQIRGERLTTASDVYALGVLLYELLTGQRPHKAVTTSQLDLEKSICLSVTERPSSLVSRDFKSTAIHTGEQLLGHVAVKRGTSLSSLRRDLAGDLDAITLHALRKDPAQRYPSVSALAFDIDQYLDRRPVAARRGNLFYHTKHFLRRHSVLLGFLGILISLLGASLAIAITRSQALIAERDKAAAETKTSQAITDFMIGVFDTDHSKESSGHATTARQLFDRAAERVHTDLIQQPAVRAQLLEHIGRIYARQGQPTRGSSFLEEALAIKRAAESSNSPAIAATLLRLGKLRMDQNQIYQAEALYLEARQLLERSKQTHTVDYAYSIYRLGEVATFLGKPRQSLSLYAQALPLFTNLFGPDHSETAMVLGGYSDANAWIGEYGDSLPFAYRAYEIYQRTLPLLHPDRLAAERRLGNALLSVGQIDQAQPLLTASFEHYQIIFPEHSPPILFCHLYMAKLRRAQGRFAQSADHAQRALQISLPIFGSQNYVTGQAHHAIGLALLDQRRFMEAEQHFEAAIKMYQAQLPHDHLHTAAAEHFLAEVFLATNRPQQARQQLEETLARLHRLNAISWRIARSESALGQALFLLGQPKEAQPLLERSYKELLTSASTDFESLAIARNRLRHFYTATHKEKELAALPIYL
jgi:eukaryotic-like serine/threonine-protein kinase